MSAKSSPTRSLPKPVDVYRHAVHFLATDGYLRSRVEEDPSLMTMLRYPGIVISSFTSELFLKCLILLEQRSPKGTHNLLTLYDQLTPEHQALVARHWDDMSLKWKNAIDADEKVFNIKIPRDLKTALSDCGDAFKLIRYVYENPRKPLFYITHLPISLRKSVEEVTGWRLDDRKTPPTSQVP
jgi:hypothetical protein